MTTMEKIDRTKESVILDAVRMGKGNFVELYEGMGHDKADAGLAWHQIRVSPKGRATMDAEYAKAFPRGIPHVRQPLTFVSDVQEELKARQIEYKQQNRTAMTKKKADASAAAPAKGAKKDKSAKAERPAKVQTPAVEATEAVADGDRGKKTAVAKQLIANGETNAAAIAEKSGAAVAYVRTLLYNYRKANKK